MGMMVDHQVVVAAMARRLLGTTVVQQKWIALYSPRQLESSNKLAL